MKNKILLIDYDIDLINSYKKYFCNHSLIEIISFSSGEEAINYVRENDDYQIVILDLILSNVDSISIIKEINKNIKSKKVIVNTSYISKKIIERLDTVEVDSILIKPTEPKVIEDIIKGDSIIKNINIEDKIKNILHDLGIPSHLKGYLYLKKSIAELYKNDHYLFGDLYSNIAENFSTNKICIEKNIRHAIEVSWNRGNFDIMDKLFGYSVCQNKGKPSNRQYIMTIVESLKSNN